MFYLLKAMPEETISAEKKESFVWTKLHRGTVSRLILKAEPQEPSAPETQDRLLSCGMEAVPVSSGEIAGWSPEELHWRVETRFFFNGNSGPVSQWNYGKDTISFRVEIYGSEDAGYGFTLFINNQPVNVDKEITVSLKDGEKTVIEGEIDVSDLEEFSAFAVLSPLVYRQNGWDDSFVSDIGYYSRQKTP